jgi:hypothetical protein
LLWKLVKTLIKHIKMNNNLNIILQNNSIKNKNHLV